MLGAGLGSSGLPLGKIASGLGLASNMMNKPQQQVQPAPAPRTGGGQFTPIQMRPLVRR
jgi:hypothetical protein